MKVKLSPFLSQNGRSLVKNIYLRKEGKRCIRFTDEKIGCIRSDWRGGIFPS